jgi:transcriptional regulator with XRE-family HTH domain
VLDDNKSTDYKSHSMARPGMLLGTALARRRSQLKVPITTIAAHLRVSHNRIANVFTGVALPSGILLNALCKELTIDIRTAKRLLAIDQFSREFGNVSLPSFTNANSAKYAELVDLVGLVPRRHRLVFMQKLSKVLRVKEIHGAA